MSDRAERLYERLLVMRCQTGDEEAFRELVGRFSPRLGYFLQKLVRRGDRAEDLLQISEQLKHLGRAASQKAEA